jgi:hypothetical protein
LVRIRRAKEICINKLKIVNNRKHEGSNEKSFAFLECKIIRRINKTKIRFRAHKISNIKAGIGISTGKIITNGSMAIKRQ